MGWARKLINRIMGNRCDRAPMMTVGGRSVPWASVLRISMGTGRTDHPIRAAKRTIGMILDSIELKDMTI